MGTRAHVPFYTIDFLFSICLPRKTGTRQARSRHNGWFPELPRSVNRCVGSPTRPCAAYRTSHNGPMRPCPAWPPPFPRQTCQSTLKIPTATSKTSQSPGRSTLCAAASDSIDRAACAHEARFYVIRKAGHSRHPHEKARPKPGFFAGRGTPTSSSGCTGR